ncbi:MAG: dihydrodipicolinate synthase family protein [Flavobacteriaceae bacterium]|nr:dihydrodipicolinate synthase family protein [Flavobacteriaceae bacterium]
MYHPKKVSWSGIYPAITTQFNNRSELDLKAFSKNLKTQMSAGINGVVLAGSLGEASTLEQPERSQLLKSALEVAQNKIPVIMNIAEASTSKAIRYAELAQYGGADGIMLLPPMRYRATDRETEQFFRDVAQSTNLPIMLYNNPIDYQIQITFEMLENLAEFSNIQAIKESSRDVTNVVRIKNKFGDRFKVLCGVDTIALESLVLGADGWVAGLCNAFPTETMAIFNLVKDNKIEQARTVLKWFLPLLELDLSPQLVQNIKYCELQTNMGTGHVRKPRLPLSKNNAKQIDEMLKIALKNRLNISAIK